MRRSVWVAALLLLLSGIGPAHAVRLDVQRSAHGIAWAQLGNGEPLLLLNGTGSPMSEWDPAFLRHLSADARVIVFDYPGLGESTARSLPTFKRMAEAASQLLTDIGVARTDVLGWSMGGFVAQQLMRSHPEQVDRVVLMGTNPGGSRTVLGPPWVQRADSDPHGGLRAYLRTNYPHRRCPQAAGERFLDRLAAAQNSGRYPASRVPARTYRQMVAAENPWLAAEHDLRGVTAEVLVLVGREDRITPLANSRRLARKIPRARLTVVPRAGHSVAFQAPADVARTVTDFLADGRSPAVLHTRCDR